MRQPFDLYLQRLQTFVQQERRVVHQHVYEFHELDAGPTRTKQSH